MNRPFILSFLVSLCAVLYLGSCAKPEGPAERMGRSLDEMHESFKDLSAEFNKQTQDEESERRKAEQKDQDRDADYTRKTEPYPGYRDNIPDHDPYYDSPPPTYRAEHY